jgi:hypothetical protein
VDVNGLRRKATAPWYLLPLLRFIKVVYTRGLVS